jgi:hypothetical protein
MMLDVAGVNYCTLRRNQNNKRYEIVHVTIAHCLQNAVALPVRISTLAGTGIMKDITECYARLRGIFSITVTPFAADGAFHHAGPARNIERVIGLGFEAS